MSSKIQGRGFGIQVGQGVQEPQGRCRLQVG
jgi:hypothetical protein